MSLPRMSLHIGDYKKDTGHLRAAGHGAYLLLIMHYWATGGLPDDDRQLAAIASMSDGEWKKWRSIIRPFFGDGWSHKRIDKEMADAQAKYERRVKAGRRGGLAKAEQSSSNARPEPQQPLTLTDNPKEQASALTDREEANARVEIVRIFEAAGQGPPDTGRVATWKAQGWDLTIAVAVIRERMRPGKRVGNLAFFDDAIREAHEKRNTNPTQPKPEILWDTIAAAYARGKGMNDPFWPPRQGPSPGESGCRCPPEILRKHGVNPETGNLETAAA